MLDDLDTFNSDGLSTRGEPDVNGAAEGKGYDIGGWLQQISAGAGEAVGLYNAATGKGKPTNAAVTDQGKVSGRQRLVTEGNALVWVYAGVAAVVLVLFFYFRKR
jgi:hypothetical protein